MVTRIPSIRNPYIESEARDWLTRLYMYEMTEEVRAGFEKWLNADPRHPATYRKLEQAWRELPLDDQLIDEFDRLNDQPKTTRTPYFYSVAASIALLFCFLTVLVWFQNQPEISHYQTRTAQIDRVELPDGSQVVIGADTAVSVEWGKSTRHLTLQNGVALFSVAPVPEVPFIVSTHNATVRVTGTQFEVRSLNDGTRVSVIEGSVSVAVPAVTKPYRLAAWDQLYIDESGASERGTAPAEIGAWQSGRLIYHDVPLAEVLDDVNRYRIKPVRLLSEELGSIRITTSFDAENTDQLLVGLRASRPITVVERADAVFLDRGSVN